MTGPDQPELQDYSNHEIVAFLESIGAAFGACQNAMTSMDETIYEVSVPTDKPHFLEQTFSVLSQFATKIRCAHVIVQQARPQLPHTTVVLQQCL